ncbi:hypothetical protein FPQ18DRAFT_403048 [Pyronema domesticum]|nr:hypothetical protein FPQ18DRAFT_403048 [Pyronema domesticum]
MSYYMEDTADYGWTTEEEEKTPEETKISARRKLTYIFTPNTYIIDILHNQVLSIPFTRVSNAPFPQLLYHLPKPLRLLRTINYTAVHQKSMAYYEEDTDDYGFSTNEDESTPEEAKIAVRPKLTAKKPRAVKSSLGKSETNSTVTNFTEFSPWSPFSLSLPFSPSCAVITSPILPVTPILSPGSHNTMDFNFITSRTQIGSGNAQFENRGYFPFYKEGRRKITSRHTRDAGDEVAITLSQDNTDIEGIWFYALNPLESVVSHLSPAPEP